MSHLRPQAVERPSADAKADASVNYLIVKPSEFLSPPVGQYRSPAILSRGEILRRRQESDAARRTVIAAPHAPGLVEMHEADMTPFPKNRGGRPKKKA